VPRAASSSAVSFFDILEDGKPGKVNFKALYRPGLVVSKKSDAFHGAVKDSGDAAGIYVEENSTTPLVRIDGR
jgi:hypothetical protein